MIIPHNAYEKTSRIFIRRQQRGALQSSFTFLTFQLCVFFAACFIPFTLFAQKSTPKDSKHKLVFNVKDCNDEQMLLVVHYNGKMMLKDSTYHKGKGVYIFEGEEKYEEGMYSLVSGTKKLMLDFIMDEPQQFTYNLDTTRNANNFSVVGSPENEEMIRFQQKSTEARRKMTDFSKKRKEFENANRKDSANYYADKMMAVNMDMEQYIDRLIEEKPSLLFSKLQKSYKEIGIPSPPVNKDGYIDSTFQLTYFITHYWDNFDLADRRFLFLPTYDSKLKDYFHKYLWYQPSDTINKYMDMMLEKTSGDSLMYRFLTQFLSSEFDQSKIIGHDAVFVHLVKNNQLAGKCSWLDEDILKRYKMRIEDLEPMLIGKKSVEMILPDTAQTDNYTKWFSSYNMPKRYRILWFYDHNCHTCQKEALELKAVYDSLENIGKLNFDVYAVNETKDIDRWKKYIIDNGYTWINVGGAKGNVNWREAYHITTNPQFYIINREKIIILNRNISKDMIPRFLADYEREEAEKIRKKNN